MPEAIRQTRALTRDRVWLALAALPPAALAAMIWAWGVDVPYWDQWVLVNHLERIAVDGGWPWADLWRPHNEHRLFVPQVLLLALARLTDWNVRVELLVNLGAALAGFAILLGLARRTLDSVPPWLPALFSLLIFHPSQWQNWLWGWQIQIFGNVTAVALGTALAARDGRIRSLVGAALCGLVATFSFANGLLFWVAALPAVALWPERRRARLLAWIAVSALVVAVYLAGLETAERPPFFEQGAGRTLKLLGGYVSIYLGAPLLGFHGHTALYGGFLLLSAGGLFLALRIRDALRGTVDGGSLADRLAPLVPWLCLAAYAVGGAFLTAIGRLHLSLGQALSSRYVTLSSLLWIALAATLARERDGPWRRVVLGAATILLLVHAAYGIARMAEAGEERARARDALVGELDDPEALQILYPDPALLHHWSTVLERLETGPFRDAGAGKE